MNATLHGNAQRVNVDMVSGNFYAALGTRPQLGRAIQPSDDATPGAGAGAVISEGVWERDFGRSPAVLGQTITVSQTPLTVVGVNPRGFTGAKNAHESPDLFVPLSMQPVVDPKGKKGSLLDDNDLWWLNVVGRARQPGAHARATAEDHRRRRGGDRRPRCARPGERTRCVAGGVAEAEADALARDVSRCYLRMTELTGGFSEGERWPT